MKKYRLFLSMLVPFLFAACSSDDPEIPVEPTPPESVDEFISFSGTLSQISRATDTNFDQGDEISVFSVESSGSDSKGIIANSGNYADNVKYFYKGTKFTASNGIFIEKDKKKYYYHAVYPYVSNAASSFKFMVKADQHGRNYTLSDLSTAHTSATSDLLVPLKFSHRLSKIVFELKGDNWPADVSFKLKNVRVSANVDLNSMKFTAGSERGDVVLADNGTMSYKAIIPPQSFTGGDDFFEITIAGKTSVYKVSKCFDIHSGQQKTYQVEYSQDKGLVEFTGDINPWEEVGDGEDGGGNDEGDYSEIEKILPHDFRVKVEKHMPIYTGNNPPEGDWCFLMKNRVVVYSSDGKFKPGAAYRYSMTVGYSYWEGIPYLKIQRDPYGVDRYKDAHICGHGNYFTAYCKWSGVELGSKGTKVFVVSGEKTPKGAKNLYHAIIQLEQDPNPDSSLLEKGVYRISKDEDGFSENNAF